MRITFLLSVFLLTTLLVAAQERTVVDSLKRELAASKPDTNQVKILLELSFNSNAKGDTQLFYANQALELSKKLGYVKGEAKSWYYLASGYYLKGDIAKAFESLQQLLKISEESNDLDGIVLATNFYGIYYGQNGDYQNALLYFKKALAQIRKKKESHFLVAMLGNVGGSYLPSSGIRHC